MVCLLLSLWKIPSPSHAYWERLRALEMKTQIRPDQGQKTHVRLCPSKELTEIEMKLDISNCFKEEQSYLWPVLEVINGF